MTRIIASDAVQSKTEYAVALPDGRIVTNSDKLDITYGSSDRVGNTYRAAEAKRLADLFNVKYAELGAQQNAVPVERTVITTYSDWTEIE